MQPITFKRICDSLALVVCAGVAIASILVIVRTDESLGNRSEVASAQTAESAEAPVVDRTPTMPDAALQLRIQRATVRVINRTAETEGSGFLLAWNGRLVVLTAGHLVNQSDVLQLSDGSRLVSATVIATHSSADASVLTAPVLANRSGLTLSDREIPDSTSFPGWSCGVDEDLDCGLRQGRVQRKTVKIAARNDAVSLLEFSAAGAHGRSGGPLVDERGDVVGLASGISGGRSYFTPVEDLRALLQVAL